MANVVVLMGLSVGRGGKFFGGLELGGFEEEGEFFADARGEDVMIWRVRITVLLGKEEAGWYEDVGTDGRVDVVNVCHEPEGNHGCVLSSVFLIHVLLAGATRAIEGCCD